MSFATTVARLFVPILLALVSGARAQGEFVNFEVPQVKPITVATVGEGPSAREILLVCNTPDNSVEIYDAKPPHRFLRRVPVGLAPVTVRYSPELGKLFTCNFIGDSVSIVRLEPSASVNAVLERTTYVGDEPCDIAFLANGVYAVITLNSKSGVTVRRAHDLSAVVPLHDLVFEDPTGSRFGVKQPRVIRALPDGRVFVLNFMGDHKATKTQLYDLDLFAYDPTSGDVYPYRATGGMGTTNHSFAMSRDGSKMFVVGTRARNLETIGVDVVRQLETGFVQSHLWVLDVIPGKLPELAPEAMAGNLPAPLYQSINLNRDYSVDDLTAVDPDRALSQPTDVLLIETADNALGVGKVFITAYHSDKVAVLHPDSSRYGGWRINQIRIPLLDDENYGAVGPRGLAYAPNADLVFTANRLDNSVSVINPRTESLVAQFPLRNDPTPLGIRMGRKFLYSAEQFSGNRIVTCASCHVDGRTDGLAWNLGSLETGPPIPPWYHDGDGQTTETMPEFPGDKGPMVTQTLQGLVNSLVNPEMQVLFTNAPYHWRGDKRRLNDFNEAFVNLQGMKDIGTPDDPKGISDADMQVYADFINTIAHPPNPEQSYDRRTPGSLGDDPDDPTQGDGALLGLKLFHIQPIVGPRSCVQCHALPDGSSNTASLVALIPGTLGNLDQLHPIETAAMRNLTQREMLLHRDFRIPTMPVVQTANFGLVHHGDPLAGFTKSINDFVGNIFLPAMPGPTVEDRVRQVESLIEFTRRLDSGIAPAVGFAYTYTPGDALNRAVSRILEQQVEEANIGLAVHVRSRGKERGLYYDLTASPPGYRDVTTAQILSPEALDELADADDGVVILQCTPVGSERRVAGLKADPARIAAERAPSDITLEPMAPATQWVEVTRLTANLEPTPQAVSLRTLRALQDAVVGPEFGIPAIRHEPPRRFRVSGKDIRHGAKLLLGMAASDQPGSLPVKLIEMPLFPTRLQHDGRRIWETTAEADAVVTMALLNGGLWAQGVAEVLLGEIPPSEPLDPERWNLFIPGILNADGTVGFSPEWQRLTVQDRR